MKNGYTLVELLTVIAIMGILSSLGYSNFHQAVANHRTRSAALNIAAFMERVSNDTRRVNTDLCVKRDGNYKLIVYKSLCEDVDENADRFDSLLIEPPVKIVLTKGNNGLEGLNFGISDAQFVPRPGVGLSCSPFEGYVEVQYGGMDLYGAAAKTKRKNSYTPKIKYSGSASWSDL
jgi:prepilin-type N-terminal cleavage/methylation domain-containing protein